MIINGNLKFHTLGSGELQNAVMENMTTGTRDALGVSAASGQLIFNTTTSQYNFFDGTNWVAFATGGNATALETEINAIETASGGIFDTDGTYDGPTVDSALGNVTTSTNLLNALSQLDSAITLAAGVDTLAELTDVNLGTLASSNLLQYNGTHWINVAATSIGEFGFKTINGDSGATVADQLGDQLGLVGAATSGITTVAEDTTDTVSFALTPTDLATTGATLDGADFLIVSDSTDSVTTAGQKTTITKLLTDLDIVTAGADGILTRTANDTYASRTISASAVAGDQGISLVDGNGVAGNPTIGLDIAGLATESGVADSTDLFAMYDGVNNVSLSLAQLNTALIASGTAIDDLTDVTITGVAEDDFLVYTSGAWVNENGATARASLDVYSTSTTDSTFVAVAGDTMSGTLNMGTNVISNVATPTTGTDAANKTYVDALVAGLTWKNSAVAASTADINLASAGTLTVDGVVTVAGDRVLVKDQSDPAENGVYVVTAGAWTRATDFDSASAPDEINSAAIFVEAGTAHADTGWTVTSDVTTLGTSNIVFTQFNGAGGVIDGIGLKKIGNTLDINMGAGIVALPSDEVGVDIFGDGGLRLSDNVTGAASTLTGAKLRVLLDGGTLSMSGAGIKVPGSGITEAELHTSVAGNGLNGGASTPLYVDIVPSHGLIMTGTQLDLIAVPNSQLANSGLTIAANSGASEVADLGETVTLSGGTGIDTVVSATNTVTTSLNASIDLLTDVDTTSGAPGTNDVLVWNGSNWVPGNPINSSSELTDVTAAATVAGQVLVSDGTNYTPAQIQYVDTQASSTTWTVVHSLNQKFVNVTVYDSSDNMIIPQSVVATDANTTTITFNTAIAGTAVVMGVSGLAAV